MLKRKFRKPQAASLHLDRDCPAEIVLSVSSPSGFFEVAAVRCDVQRLAVQTCRAATGSVVWHVGIFAGRIRTFTK